MGILLRNFMRQAPDGTHQVDRILSDISGRVVGRLPRDVSAVAGFVDLDRRRGARQPKRASLECADFRPRSLTAGVDPGHAELVSDTGLK